MATNTERRKALPGRLEAVLELVPEDANTVADIGYDHGYALVLAAQKLPEANLCGVEKIPGAARRFYTQAVSPDLLERIELFDGDGFQPITHRPLDAAILAGMGEATIIRIASMHPQLTEKVKRLVVCTPQMPAVLRPAFARLGYGIADERLAYDGRRFYEVVAFERGCAPCTDPLELLFGPTLLAHPCCAEYVDHRRDDWKSLLDYHGPHLSPLEEWPEPSADAAGEFQRIKVRALDEARRRVRQR